jgi:MFS family permease
MRDATAQDIAPRHGDELRRVLAVVSLSVYGGWFSTIALMVIAYRASGTVTAPAALVVVRLLARLLGALPGGVFADRHGAGRTVRVCAAVQALVCAAVVLDSGAGAGLWLVYVATAIGQTAAGMAQSATGALVAQSVPAALRGRANGLVGAVMNSSVLVGPGLAGVLVGTVSPTAVLTINAVTALATVAVGSGLSPVRAVVPADRKRTWLAGPRLVLRDRFLRSFALAWGAETIAVGAAQGVFVAAAVERFGGDAALGMLYAVVGSGAVAGSGVATKWRPATISGLTMLAPSAGAILCIAAFAMAPSPAVGVAGLVVAGFMAGVYQPWGMTELQRRVGPDVAGRVSGAVVTVQFTGTVLGSLIVLVALTMASWQHALLGACLAGATVMCLLMPLCRERHTSGHAPAASLEREPASAA